mgnify:CR=1 FL=1
MYTDEDLFIIYSFDYIFWINFILISVGAMAFGQGIYFKATSTLELSALIVGSIPEEPTRALSIKSIFS